MCVSMEFLSFFESIASLPEVSASIMASYALRGCIMFGFFLERVGYLLLSFLRR